MQYEVLDEPLFLKKRVNAFFQAFASTQLPPAEATQAIKSINFTQRDYLDIAHHPDVLTSELQETDEKIRGMKKFTKSLASFLSTEAAYLINSFHSPNTLLLSAMTEPHIPLYLDTGASEAIKQSCRYLDIAPFVYPRNDIKALSRLMKQQGAGILLVDSLSEQDGSLADLESLMALASTHDCLTIVDESDTLGVRKNGAGLIGEMSIKHPIHFITTQLDRSFCHPGGCILGSQRHINYLHHHLAPALQVHTPFYRPNTLLTTFGLIQDHHWRRVKLNMNIAYLRSRSKYLGLPLYKSDTQIITYTVKNPAARTKLDQKLADRGLQLSWIDYDNGIDPMTLLRVILTPRHSKQEMDNLLDALSTILL